MEVVKITRDLEPILEAIRVYGYWKDRDIFYCEGNFKTEYYANGVKENAGWNTIENCTLEMLKEFQNRQIPVIYANTIEDIYKLKAELGNEWMERDDIALE